MYASITCSILNLDTIPSFGQTTVVKDLSLSKQIYIHQILSFPLGMLISIKMYCQKVRYQLPLEFQRMRDSKL